MDHCEPASKIIALFGGVGAVAKITGADRSRVVRWRSPKAKGGTGGTIPAWHVPHLLEHARANDIPVTADDFLPAPKSSRVPEPSHARGAA